MHDTWVKARPTGCEDVTISFDLLVPSTFNATMLVEILSQPVGEIHSHGEIWHPFSISISDTKWGSDGTEGGESCNSNFLLPSFFIQACKS